MKKCDCIFCREVMKTLAQSPSKINNFINLNPWKRLK